MDFSFNADQISLGETVSKVLADHPGLLAPEPLPASQDAAWDALAGLGLFALLVPERFGGAGLSLVDLAPAAEALGAGLAPPAAAATLAVTDFWFAMAATASKASGCPGLPAAKRNAPLPCSKRGRATIRRMPAAHLGTGR